MDDTNVINLCVLVDLIIFSILVALIFSTGDEKKYKFLMKISTFFYQDIK